MNLDELESDMRDSDGLLILTAGCGDRNVFEDVRELIAAARERDALRESVFDLLAMLDEQNPWSAREQAEKIKAARAVSVAEKESNLAAGAERPAPPVQSK